MTNLDLSKLRLTTEAFSTRPMSFCSPQFLNPLAAILNICLLEAAPRSQITTWQNAQLRNLIIHATARSRFWNDRIKSRNLPRLSDLPILTRQEVIHQVFQEGALLKKEDKIDVFKHSTSGSSGTPVHFHLSKMNSDYNVQRSIAQYFMERRDFTRNKTRFKNLPLKDHEKRPSNGFVIKNSPNWIGPFASFMQSGPLKLITYLDPDLDALQAALAGDELGYLVVQPRLLDTLLQMNQLERLLSKGVDMLLPVTEAPSREVRDVCSRLKIPIRTSYSCEEVGLIGTECVHHPEHYHIAQSNVLVESMQIQHVNGPSMGRILLTHLNSYATPFIRYDVGDVGTLLDKCPCGHDGQTLTNVVGRSKGLILHDDQRVSPFYVKAGDLCSFLQFKEYRIRQTHYNKLVLELSGCKHFGDQERRALIDYLRRLTSPKFQIEFILREEIDWGASVKRLAFKNEVIK